MKLTPQQERVLKYLKDNGSINPLESLMECSVYRLSAIIFKLRTDHKIKIKTKITSGLNKYKEVCKYAAYELEKQNDK